MNSFLHKISQLSSVCDVTFLSSNGEIIFYSQKYATPLFSGSKPVVWNDFISKLSHPQSAEFIFTQGRYYLQRTEIGYLIIGMRNESDLNKLKIACTNVREKLENHSVRKQTLLKMLMEVSDEYKPHVVKGLMTTPDRDIANSLITLLNKHAQAKTPTESRLLLIVCQALGYCSSHEALTALQSFLSTYTSGPTPANPTIEQSARISIQQLEQSKPTTTIEQPPVAQQTPRPQKVSNISQPEQPEKPPTTPNFPECRQVVELLKQNKKDQALSALLQLIDTFAKKREFQKAEQLRDWLIDIDAMALSQIIRAADIIEEEKKASISKQHLTTWKELISTISAEAFSALYHSSVIKKYDNGKEIVQQGDIQSTLFLVNSGKVQIHAECRNRSESITVLEEGAVFGAETFFEVSVWTVSARSLGAELFELSYSPFNTLKDNYPALEAKLLEYCGRFKTTRAFFDRTRKTRRKFERKKSSNRVSFTLQKDNSNGAGKSTKGDLLDISSGGLSLSFHASQKKAATALLSKNVCITIRCEISAAAISRNSIVRAIGGHDPIGNRYSMHVEFNAPLTSAELRQILTISKQK